MFDQLSDRLQKMMKFLRGEGKITEKNMGEALKMIRMAFLEADVNYKVVRDFEERIKAKALGEEVLSSLTPAQQVIKVVRDELTSILGGAEKPLSLLEDPSIHLHARRPPGKRQDDDLRQAGQMGPGHPQEPPPRLFRSQETRSPGPAEDDCRQSRTAVL